MTPILNRSHWCRPILRRASPRAGSAFPGRASARSGIFIHALQAGPAGDGSQKPNGGRRVCPAEAGRHTDSAGRAYWVGKPGESLPLDPVEADEVVTAGKDRPKHPQEGANRVRHVLKAEPARADATDRRARSEVMALGGSASPTGRGTDGAPARSAAPVFLRFRHGLTLRAGRVAVTHARAGSSCVPTRFSFTP